MPWPTAIVVSIAILVFGGLSWKGADTSDLMLILLTLIGGVGWSELKAVKDNTNGTQAAMLSELRETRKLLAQSTPPPVPPAEE